jgi:hypothetical protein
MPNWQKKCLLFDEKWLICDKKHILWILKKKRNSLHHTFFYFLHSNMVFEQFIPRTLPRTNDIVESSIDLLCMKTWKSMKYW